MLIAELDQSSFRSIACQISKTILETDNDVEPFIFRDHRWGDNANGVEQIAAHVQGENFWFFVVSFSLGIDEKMKRTPSLNIGLGTGSFFAYFFSVFFRSSNQDGNCLSSFDFYG